MKIRVKTIIHPTEAKEKVLQAVSNIFSGTLRIRDLGDGYYEVIGESSTLDSLDKLYDMIRVEQIITAVRSYLQKHSRSGRIKIMIHKQAAYMGKLSLVDSDKESPLGAITITIDTDNIDEVIDWLAPEIGKPKSKKKKNSRSKRAHRKQLLKKTFK